MQEIKKTVVSLPLEGDEIDKFETAFQLSAYRTKTEFLRQLIFAYLEEKTGKK